jgi:hypothetical protein
MSDVKIDFRLRCAHYARRLCAIRRAVGARQRGCSGRHCAHAPQTPLIASVMFGTVLGFVMNYVLEKRWSFLDCYGGHTARCRDEAIIRGNRTQRLAAVMDSRAKHAAPIGLSPSNLTKYMPARRYIFSRAAA